MSCIKGKNEISSLITAACFLAKLEHIFRSSMPQMDIKKSLFSEPAAEIEMAVKYAASMMGFLGVNDMEKVVIEGHNQLPDKAEEIIAAGLEKAVKVASMF